MFRTVAGVSNSDTRWYCLEASLWNVLLCSIRNNSRGTLDLQIRGWQAFSLRSNVFGAGIWEGSVLGGGMVATTINPPFVLMACVATKGVGS
jgi:hypothetical protein